MMNPIPPEESLIEYPSDFPIKVMGATHDAFAPTIIEVVVAHDPTADLGHALGDADTRLHGDFTGVERRGVHGDQAAVRRPAGVVLKGTKPGSASIRASHARNAGYDARSTLPSGALTT